jgi:hypothetical protein
MRSAVGRSVLTVALVVVTIVFGLDRLLEVTWPAGSVWPVRLVLLLCAVVIAGIAYHRWSVGDSRAPQPIAAMVTALIGGASLASTVTSAPDGQIYGSGLLAAVSVVGLTFAVAVLNLQARENR